eukprot:jgi/Psemu1/241041/estExt_Genewise1.C_2090042
MTATATTAPKTKTKTSPKTVAVLYATKGGMGDVGKFIVALSLAQDNDDGGTCTSTSTTEITNTDLGLSLDVEDPDLRTSTEQILENARDEITKIDAGDDSAEERIGELLEGVDAVISCLGSRQSELGRWCALGTKKVIGAMATKKIRRLVCLSSFGIGRDFMKPSFIKITWGIMLRTSLRGVYRDLNAMEKAVRESDLDYLLVRPVGLTPSEPQRGSCDTIVSKNDHGGHLEIFMAKPDAARFLLGEALGPTLHRGAVTIGYAGPRSAGGDSE